MSRTMGSYHCSTPPRPPPLNTPTVLVLYEYGYRADGPPGLGVHLALGNPSLFLVLPTPACSAGRQQARGSAELRSSALTGALMTAPALVPLAPGVAGTPGTPAHLLDCPTRTSPARTVPFVINLLHLLDCPSLGRYLLYCNEPSLPFVINLNTRPGHVASTPALATSPTVLASATSTRTARVRYRTINQMAAGTPPSHSLLPRPAVACSVRAPRRPLGQSRPPPTV